MSDERIEKVREALEPFAREADDWSDKMDCEDLPADATDIKVGDLRRAKAVLSILDNETKATRSDEALREELAEVTDLAKFASRREQQFFAERNALIVALKQVKLKALRIADKDYSEPRMLKLQAEIREIIDAALNPPGAE